MRSKEDLSENRVRRNDRDVAHHAEIGFDPDFVCCPDNDEDTPAGSTSARFADVRRHPQIAGFPSGHPLAPNLSLCLIVDRTEPFDLG